VRWLAPIAVAILLIVLILATQESKPVKDEQQRASTYFTDETGARALLLVSEQLLPDVQVHQHPLQGLEADTLIVAGPGRPLQEGEEEALDAWLAGGGQLILATRDGWDGYLESYDIKLEAKDATPQQWRIDRETLLHMRGNLKWEGEFKPLARSGDQILAVEVPVDKGRIVVIGDPYVVSNLALKEADNAVWLIGLMKGRVRFDEYHHGFGDRAGLLQNIWRFLHTSWGLGFAQLALAGLLAATWMRARLGRPVRRLSRRLQEPLLLMEARAGLFQSAQARTLALQQMCTPEMHDARLQELLRKPSLTSAELLEGAQLAARLREEPTRVH